MILTILMAALPLQTPAQFDLVCEVHGTETAETLTTGQRTVTDNIATTMRYRVDLDRNIWCRDECEQAIDINRLDEANLVFEDRVGRPMLIYEAVNRTTGWITLRSRHIGLGTATETNVQGRCTLEAFSGMPAGLF